MDHDEPIRDSLTCRVSSAMTGGTYCAFEVVTLPGQGVPLHIHSNEDEVYYILEGMYEIECGGNVFTAETGAVFVLPRLIPHAFRNIGTVPTRAFTLFIPGGFDMFVQELNGLNSENSEDVHHRASIRRKYGIQMIED